MTMERRYRYSRKFEVVDLKAKSDVENLFYYSNEISIIFDNPRIEINTTEFHEIFHVSDYQNDNTNNKISRGVYYILDKEKFIDLIIDFQENKLDRFAIAHNHSYKILIDTMSEKEKDELLFNILTNNSRGRII